VKLKSTGLSIIPGASLYGINYVTGGVNQGRFANSSTSSIGTGTQTYISGEGTFNSGNAELVLAATNYSGGNAQLWLSGVGNGLSSPRAYAVFYEPAGFFDGLTVGSATLGSKNVPTHMLDVYGNGWFRDKIIIDTQQVFQARQPRQALRGLIVWDASFVYICTATDTWRRRQQFHHGETITQSAQSPASYCGDSARAGHPTDQYIEGYTRAALTLRFRERYGTTASQEWTNEQQVTGSIKMQPGAKAFRWAIA